MENLRSQTCRNVLVDSKPSEQTHSTPQCSASTEAGLTKPSTDSRRSVKDWDIAWSHSTEIALRK